MFARQLSPELLDELPPTHPDALANRRDLARINRWLGTFSWMAESTETVYNGTEKILELGAGEGALAAHLHRRGIPSDGIDLWPQPANWPETRTWWRDDLRRFADYAEYGIIVGNFIFHQFSAEDLAELGRQFQHVRAIIACEPARWRSSQLLFGVLARALGANHVTLHDGHVSIAAGFLGNELPLALGLDRQHWRWTARTTIPGLYRMIATRIS